MNKCTIIGNLVKNPELRSTTAGVTVCGFTVAVNRKKTANNPDPGADYFNVSAWRGLGDICGKYLQKGSKVYVCGSVSVRTWSKEDKHGASLEITADDVEFLTPRAESSPADAASGFQAVETDELPFD
jgi:single-strand DNA-binding protein